MADRITLRHLRYFVAVADARSFRGASDALHVAQPPLSRQVAHLEAELGYRLLARGAQGATPTPAGERALAHARAALAAWDAGVAALRRDASAKGSTLRVGVSFAVRPADLHAVQAALRRTRAGRDATFVQQASHLAVADIAAGRLDAALVALPVAIGTLECIPLKRVRAAIALPARHRAARKREVALADVADLTLYWFPRRDSPGYYDHCAAVFRAAGYAPRLNVEYPGNVQVFNDIALGKGCTIGPETAAVPRLAGLAVRRLREGQRLGLTLALVFVAGRAGEPIAALTRAARRAMGGRARGTA